MESSRSARSSVAGPTADDEVMNLAVGDCSVSYLSVQNDALDAENPAEGGEHGAGDATVPLLLRFPVVLFGAPLGIVSQSVLYHSVSKWHTGGFVGSLCASLNWGFWVCGNSLFVIVALLYAARVASYPWTLRREWSHDVRSNFAFAPIMILLLSALGAPESLRSESAMKALWWVCNIWYVLLALPLYQSWYRKASRTLHHGNPTYQIAVVSNFLLATVGFKLGYMDLPLANLAIGFVFQTTVFIGLFTATPPPHIYDEAERGDEARNVRSDSIFTPCCTVWLTRPSKIWTIRDPSLNPVMFLFIAPPSLASVSVAGYAKSFDNPLSLGCFFLGLFMYALQIASINVFFCLPFTPSWWAYTFPMTAAATASVAYAKSRPDDIFPHILCVTLVVLSTLWVTVVLVRSLIALAKGKFLPPVDPLCRVPPGAKPPGEPIDERRNTAARPCLCPPPSPEKATACHSAESAAAAGAVVLASKTPAAEPKQDDVFPAVEAAAAFSLAPHDSTLPPKG